MKAYLKMQSMVLGQKYNKKNIYRIQGYNSIMCEYICIVFIDFILKGKSLLD